MSKAKRSQTARKAPKTSKSSKPAKPAPPVAATVAAPERQPTLPGVSARKSPTQHFALYLTTEQRAFAEKLAAHLSTPWNVVSLNQAIRAGFLEGAKVLLARKPGGENSANPGNSGD